MGLAGRFIASASAGDGFSVGLRRRSGRERAAETVNYRIRAGQLAAYSASLEASDGAYFLFTAGGGGNFIPTEKKMEDQAEFVRWWDENVRPDGRPPKTVSAQKQLSVDEAEDQTGITKLQAHKWRRRLKEPDAPTGA